MVDRRRIAAAVFADRLGAVQGGGALRHLAHALFEAVAHLRPEAAHRAADMQFVGDDVVGRAALDKADADQRRLDRVGFVLGRQFDLHMALQGEPPLINGRDMLRILSNYSLAHSPSSYSFLSYAAPHSLSEVDRRPARAKLAGERP